MKLTESGQKVFEARYAKRDEEGKVCENFEEAVKRLAHVAAIPEGENSRVWEEKFANIIGQLLFIPSTPIWANMGKDDRNWQPGACFVLAVEDSLSSMYETLKQTAMVFKSGGGVGYNFSTIRPKGALVRSTKGKASGVVELIKLYDASSNMVMQGGVRRGASMGILNIDHPEIIDFIRAKLDGAMVNFNLSVGVTDDFMQALENDEDWDLVFNNEIYATYKAKEIWEEITEAAYACGDPGIVFVDRIQKYNPVPDNFLNSTNPCGEQPLSPGESCLLGSINLAKMVSDDGTLNKELLANTVKLAIRFLDNLIDIAAYPLDLIEKASKSTRKVGLGFTGLHDALIMGGFSYDSDEGRAFAGEITSFIQQTAHKASEELGEEKGCFPLWEKSIFYPDNIKRRNAACITIAPTGSVTSVAGCEGYGIEPIFAVAYTKRTNVAGDFEVFSPLFLNACQKYGVSSEVLSKVALKGSCQDIEGIPVEIAKIFRGAQDIAFIDHILMQAEVQKYVENAVSKTINMPNNVCMEDISKSYLKAYELGLKGITIFRDGCKQGTVIVGKESSKEESNQKVTCSENGLKRGEIMPRPKTAHGVTHCLHSGCGKIYLTVNYQEENGEILETFITTGSDGGCLVYTEATSRLISLAIRGGIPVDKIIEQLMGTHSCPSYMMSKGSGKYLSPGKSCASAIASKLNTIKKDLDRKKKLKAYENHENLYLEENECNLPVCEICGSKLKVAEGCYVCLECGFSKC